jgi:rhamnosyltransferase
MATATAVVLYRPSPEFIRKVADYADYIQDLIVVDNTDDADHSADFRGIPNLKYLSCGGNKGVATALNVAARSAVESGCHWMLMLDQDSALSRRAYDRLRNELTRIDGASVGLVSVLAVPKEDDSRSEQQLPDTRDVFLTITSGSVLNLDAYQRCGLFEDKLFIDHVDHEYCLRLHRAGYRVIQLTRVVLDHTVGEVKDVSFLGKRLRLPTHKPFRAYYGVRNGCYVGAKYFAYRPQFLRSVCRGIAQDVIRALLFEDQKLLRLRMMLLGFTDFCRGRYGKLNSDPDAE